MVKVHTEFIEDRNNRRRSLAGRINGISKNAYELGLICHAKVSLIVFSESEELVFHYSTPPASMVDLIHRYEAATNKQLCHEAAYCTDRKQQMVAAISKLRREYQQLEARFKTYTGEDLSSLNSVVELAMLEKQLESAISKVHARKDELFINVTEELQVKINDNGCHEHADAAGVETEETTMAESPLPQSEKSAVSTMLCLWPQTEKSPLSTAATNTPSTSSSVCSHGGSSSLRGLQLW